MNSYENDKLSLEIGDGYIIINGNKYLNQNISENSSISVFDNEVEINGRKIDLESGEFVTDKLPLKYKLIYSTIVILIALVILLCNK